MNRIRVILGPMPQLLRDILKSGFQADEWIAVVGETGDDTALLPICAQHRPDVIVVEADDTEAPGFDWAAQIDPAVKILTVTPDGRTARMHWLEWRIDTVHEASLPAIREAILQAVQRTPAKVSSADQISRDSRRYPRSGGLEGG